VAAIRCIAGIGGSGRNSPQWVETAISDFSKAAAQIGNADYLVIRAPAAGMAEYRTLMVVAVNVSSGLNLTVTVSRHMPFVNW
jgi:hypothetical protein